MFEEHVESARLGTVTSTEIRIGLSDYVQLNRRNLYSEVLRASYIVETHRKCEKRIEDK